MPAIVRNGAEWFANLGKPNNGGPKVFSVSGHVNKSRQFRDPPRHAVRRPAGDGRRRAQRPQAEGGDPRRFVDAGAAGGHDDGVHHGLRLDPEGRFRPRFGRGRGDGRNHLHGRACQRIARFYFKESCGQCTPCREGTGWMYRMLTRIANFEATMDDLAMLRAAARRSRATPSAPSARRRRGRCRASCAISATNSNTPSSTSRFTSTTNARARWSKTVEETG